MPSTNTSENRWNGGIGGKRRRTKQKLWNPVIYDDKNKNKWWILLLYAHGSLIASSCVILKAIKALHTSTRCWNKTSNVCYDIKSINIAFDSWNDDWRSVTKMNQNDRNIFADVFNARPAKIRKHPGKVDFSFNKHWKKVVEFRKYNARWRYKLITLANLENKIFKEIS